MLQLAEMANQFQSLIVREVLAWTFASTLASSIGYGQLVIDIKDHRIDRAQLVWGMKPERTPPKTA